MDLTMASKEILIVTAIALLVGSFAYLIAQNQGRQALAKVKESLSAAGASNQELEKQRSTATETIRGLSTEYRSLELEHQKLATEVKALTARKSELQAESGHSKAKAESAVQEKHVAEKSNESAQAKLSLANEQTLEFQQRLSTQLEELQAERGTVSQLKHEIAESGKRGKSFEIKAEEAQQQLKDVKSELTAREDKLEALQSRYESLNREFAELKTTQSERDASHVREVETFEKQKGDLTQQFKVLSTEILAANTKSLQESSKQTLSSVINPFQQSIDGFKKEVQDIHHRETTQRSELKKELESLKELNQKITTEAHELSTALRGQKKLQGNWGELVLENVLDRSGLVLGKDYKREVSFTTEEGRQRPDAVVYLPQDKHLIIDAKVSLNAYTRFINGEDEAERKIALDEHVKAMGDRIKELADRDYYKLPGLNSPEMVFMFVPIESAFVEALKADESLFQKAIENNVLVATPTTLLTSLNIVRQLWRHEDQNKHTAALAQKAEGVFKKLNTFLSNFEGVKKGLDKASEAYLKAEGQLVSGRGNLVKQVGDFKNLAPSIKAELPSYFTDKANLEVDYIPADELLNMHEEGQRKDEIRQSGTNTESIVSEQRSVVLPDIS